MSWKGLLDKGRLKVHRTSLGELNDLRSVVKRDLEDAAIRQVSADRRFATAYNAALQLAKMVIACEGLGHHETSFQALELAMGPTIRPFSIYFDACRRKRNTVDYDISASPANRRPLSCSRKSPISPDSLKTGFSRTFRTITRVDRSRANCGVFAVKHPDPEGLST